MATLAPLADIRVIDLSTGIAGPVAALMLAEAGAEVVRIEPPGGDPQRGTPGYAVRNRSKRSVLLDLPAERAALDRLLAGADVLVHSLAQLAAAELGIDDESLRRNHPHLIVCGVTGFPIGHPLHALPASDTLVLAEAGVLDEQAAVCRAGPVYLKLPLGSWHAASLAAAGIIARLIHRDRGGAPGPAHTSLFQGALVPMGMYWNRAETPTKMLQTGMPKDMQVSIFQCSDGKWLHVMFGCDNSPLVRAEFAARGEDWVREQDEAVGTAFRIPFTHFGATKALMKTRPRDFWVQHLQEHDVPVQPVLEMGEIYRDEQARVNGYVVAVDDPAFGATLQPGRPFAMEDPLPNPFGCRALGADTAAILAGHRQPPVLRQTGTRPASGAPLEGVKVLDLGVALAGPFGAMLLADLGADVIKVEPPEGEMMRVLESNFAGCQRGKRAVALQLKDPASRAPLQRLVEWADIVHHNQRSAAASKLGFDISALRQWNPAVVTCHVSAYGPLGTRKDWPGMDQMFQSSCGWELAGAGQDNPPIWHRFGFTDHLCALASVVGTLLALRSRDRSGQGQHVSASLLGAAILTISETVALASGECTPVATVDSQQLGLHPLERIYPTADGWIAVSDESGGADQRMIAALGAADIGDSEAKIAALGSDDALADLAAAGVASARVKLAQKEAFFASEDNAALGLLARYPHPVYGMFAQVGAFWDFGDLAVRLDRAPPTIGQHTEEILSSLGIADAEAFADLVAAA